MKRTPALQQLSREHHGALVLALRIAAAEQDNTEAALMAAVPDIFARELAPHFAEEESDLLPLLNDAGQAGVVERTLADHKRLRQLVTDIANGDRASLAAFGRELKAHVRFEERELFVIAESCLPAALLQTLH